MMRLFSMGKLTERLRRPIGQVESAIRELAIEPELTLNEISYFSEAAENAIEGELHKRDLRRLESERPARGKA
jgi:hypothetical protein